MGFEPTRAEHNGLAVHPLNHSGTSSHTHRFHRDGQALEIIFQQGLKAKTILVADGLSETLQVGDTFIETNSLFPPHSLDSMLNVSANSKYLPVGELNPGLRRDKPGY